MEKRTSMCKGLDVGGNLKGGKDSWSNMRLKNRNRPDHTGPERSCPGFRFLLQDHQEAIKESEENGKMGCVHIPPTPSPLNTQHQFLPIATGLPLLSPFPNSTR